MPGKGKKSARARHPLLFQREEEAERRRREEKRIKDLRELAVLAREAAEEYDADNTWMHNFLNKLQADASAAVAEMTRRA